MTSTSFTLVLSGGGLKGLAHIGVLQALAERGLEPSLVIGSSMGSLIAAGWAAGLGPAELYRRARSVRRRDVFQVNHAEMALRRLLAPAIYRREPLEALIAALVGERTFRDLERPLLVNSVELNGGSQVLWGLPGLQDVRVADAVFASCALPGLFPPRYINGRWYVDGAVVENLPVRAAASAGRGPVIAVNLNSAVATRQQTELEGFPAIYARGLEMVMQTQIEGNLRGWVAPPLVMVQPRVEHISMFAFDRTGELVEEGYLATLEALDALGAPLDALRPGIHPQRPVRVVIDESRCIACGACALSAPHAFRMGANGKAEPTAPVHHWSPMDETYARLCPTGAIRIYSARLTPTGQAVWGDARG